MNVDVNDDQACKEWAREIFMSYACGDEARMEQLCAWNGLNTKRFHLAGASRLVLMVRGKLVRDVWIHAGRGDTALARCYKILNLLRTTGFSHDHKRRTLAARALAEALPAWRSSPEKQEFVDMKNEINETTRIQREVGFTVGETPAIFEPTPFREDDVVEPVTEMASNVVALNVVIRHNRGSLLPVLRGQLTLFHQGQRVLIDVNHVLERGVLRPYSDYCESEAECNGPK